MARRFREVREICEADEIRKQQEMENQRMRDMRRDVAEAAERLLTLGYEERRILEMEKKYLEEREKLIEQKRRDGNVFDYKKQEDELQKQKNEIERQKCELRELRGGALEIDDVLVYSIATGYNVNNGNKLPPFKDELQQEINLVLNSSGKILGDPDDITFYDCRKQDGPEIEEDLDDFNYDDCRKIEPKYDGVIREDPDDITFDDCRKQDEPEIEEESFDDCWKQNDPDVDLDDLDEFADCRKEPTKQTTQSEAEQKLKELEKEIAEEQKRLEEMKRSLVKDEEKLRTQSFDSTNPGIFKNSFDERNKIYEQMQHMRNQIADMTRGIEAKEIQAQELREVVASQGAIEVGHNELELGEDNQNIDIKDLDENVELDELDEDIKLEDLDAGNLDFAAGYVDAHTHGDFDARIMGDPDDIKQSEFGENVFEKDEEELCQEH